MAWGAFFGMDWAGGRDPGEVKSNLEICGTDLSYVAEGPKSAPARARSNFTSSSPITVAVLRRHRGLLRRRQSGRGPNQGLNLKVGAWQLVNISRRLGTGRYFDIKEWLLQTFFDEPRINNVQVELAL